MLVMVSSTVLSLILSDVIRILGAVFTDALTTLVLVFSTILLFSFSNAVSIPNAILSVVFQALFLVHRIVFVALLPDLLFVRLTVDFVIFSDLLWMGCPISPSVSFQVFLMLNIVTMTASVNVKR